MVEFSRAFAALADPTRLAVFECIRGCGGSLSHDTESGRCGSGGKGIAACEVRGCVQCAPSTLTHHLNSLREAGLIRTERRGRQVYAVALPEALAEMAGYFCGRPCECFSQMVYTI